MLSVGIHYRLILGIGYFLLFLFPFNSFSQRGKSACKDTLYALTYKLKKYNRKGIIGKEQIVKIMVYADTNKKNCRNKKISFREYQKYLGLQFYYRDSSGNYRERYLYYYNNGERDSCLGFKDSIGTYLPFITFKKHIYSPWETYTSDLNCLICKPGTYEGRPTLTEIIEVLRTASEGGDYWSFRFRFYEYVENPYFKGDIYFLFLRYKWEINFIYSPSMWIDEIRVEKHGKLKYEMFLIDKKVYGS